MTKQLRKQYDALHKKIEAIYLGATGYTWIEGEPAHNVYVSDAKRFLDAIGNLDGVEWAEFTKRFNDFREDGITDLDIVTDYLFEKGLRA